MFVSILRRRKVACVVAAMCMLSGGSSYAYEVPSHTMDGGGGTSSNGGYVISGTIGQHDAGFLHGGAYVISGGFWSPFQGFAESPLAAGRFDLNGQVKPCSNDTDCRAGETGPDPQTVCRDSDGDGIHDACYVARQRFLSIKPNPANAGLTYAYRISLDSGAGGIVSLGFASMPTDVAVTGPGPVLFHLSRVESTPQYLDWTTLAAGVVTIGDCEISPGRQYLVQAIAQGMDVGDDSNYSLPLHLPTPAHFGDVTGGGSPGDPPNGAMGNLIDVFAIVLGFQNVQNEPKDWLDLDPSSGGAQPNLLVNLADAFAAVQAFQGNGYPGPAPLNCP